MPHGLVPPENVPHLPVGGRRGSGGRCEMLPGRSVPSLSQRCAKSAHYSHTLTEADLSFLSLSLLFFNSLQDLQLKEGSEIQSPLMIQKYDQNIFNLRGVFFFSSGKIVFY